MLPVMANAGTTRHSESSPTIDILLPFYGDVRLMKEAVASVCVRMQSDPRWRLIVVDDHQPDLTVAEWFASLHDSRIEYHRNPANLGANLNYRRALELATGDLVVFLGADDRMLPEYVARARTCFPTGDESVALYQPGVRVIGGDGSPVQPVGDRVKRWIRPGRRGLCTHGGEAAAVRLLVGNWTYFPSICWKRDRVAAVGFDRRFHVVQDLALILDLLADGGVMMVDDHVTFEYRRHAASDSALKTMSSDRFAEEVELFCANDRRFRGMGWHRAARAARLHLTSRINALTTLPVAVAAGREGAARAMWRHVVIP